MKKISTQLVVFLLAILIIVNTFYPSIVYASDEWVVEKDVTDDMKPGNKFMHNANKLLWYLLAQCGALVNANIDTLYDNTEWLEKVDKYSVVVKNTTTGELGYKFDKLITDDMLNKIKESTKEPENGGYELVPTVPASKVSSLYFKTSAERTTFTNLLRDNNGTIGFYYYSGYRACFYKVPSNLFWVKGTWNYGDSNGSHEFYRVDGYKNVNESSVWFNAVTLDNTDTPIKNWNDTDNISTNSSNYWNSSYLNLYDSFSYLVDSKMVANPFQKAAFLITSSGAPVPVFNTIHDAVAYTVEHNLYYTSSDYTGEGREIIIPFDEIDKILSGYYDGMYDLLQQLIEQNGGNALTPEQLQKLVDEVQASFGMIQDAIDKGFEQQDILIQKNSEILQNIADALNAFFSRDKESRTEFLKEFREYAKGEKERDGELQKLLMDFIDGQKYTPDTSTGDNSGGGTGDGTGGGTGDGTDSGNWFEKILNAIRDGFDDVVKQLKKIKRWTALDSLFDGLGVATDVYQFLQDLLGGGTDAADKVADFVALGADTLGDVRELVDGKFPFCIPVDILTLMQALAHEPETPRFEIPIVLERYGINEKLVIDFSDFEYISKISRTFLTIAWCFALMNVTTKITNMKSI